MTFSAVQGIDYALPAAPPLRLPPLSLLALADTLIDNEGLTSDISRAQQQLASALSGNMELGSPGDAAARALAEMSATDHLDAVTQAEALVSERMKTAADLMRWEQGFLYLPELGLGGLELFTPGSGTTKATGVAQTPFAWWDPFVVVASDRRSTFGLPDVDLETRAQRALRGLMAHESWECESEFWAGNAVSTNFHLSASPSSLTSSPHRTVNPWTNPTAAPGTTLGTAVGLRASLAALDQAIAESDAGVGMIHATPYLVQCWMSVYPFIRDSGGRIFTVNGNIMVPGYGYPGTGPDTGAVQTRTTGGGQQWAYATEMVYKLRGDAQTYPWDFRQGAPSVNVNNVIEVRAERSWALVTNRLLRSAVLVDTTIV